MRAAYKIANREKKKNRTVTICAIEIDCVRCLVIASCPAKNSVAMTRAIIPFAAWSGLAEVAGVELFRVKFAGL